MLELTHLQPIISINCNVSVPSIICRTIIGIQAAIGMLNGRSRVSKSSFQFWKYSEVNKRHPMWLYVQTNSPWISKVNCRTVISKIPKPINQFSWAHHKLNSEPGGGNKILQDTTSWFPSLKHQEYNTPFGTIYLIFRQLVLTCLFVISHHLPSTPCYSA